LVGDYPHIKDDFVDFNVYRRRRREIDVIGVAAKALL
jgi:hypothetical protein